MESAFELNATGDDVYRHFVMPIPVSQRRFVSAWELRAENSPALHHATMEIDQTGTSRHLDHQDPAPGYEGLIAHTTMAPDGYFLDWAPGHSPYRAPEGMAFPIEGNSDLVLMLHLRPTGRAGTGACQRGPLLHRHPTDARPCAPQVDATGPGHSVRALRDTKSRIRSGRRSISTCSPCSLTPTIWPRRLKALPSSPMERVCRSSSSEIGTSTGKASIVTGNRSCCPPGRP